MITFFTIPKPFRGHIAVIQRNALASWRSLRPECELLVLGDEFGSEEAACGVRARWLPQVRRNDYGTPLLSDAFKLAADQAQNPLLCYVNADILLMSDFMTAVSQVDHARAVCVGQRWDLDLHERLETSSGWEKVLRERVCRSGKLHPPAGSDYFVFRKDSGLAELPAFAVGRPGWDNWFIYNARKRGFAVIDLTPATTVVHQNHDYSHVPCARTAWEGPEGDRQLELASGADHIYTLSDATHVLNDGKVRRYRDFPHLYRQFSTAVLRNPVLGLPLRLLRAMRRLGHGGR